MMLENRKILFVALGAALVLLYMAQFAYSCNEMICASIVSKCMLTQSCKCDMKNCSCCKECSECLSYLYTECCSCLEMCPKPNETTNELSKQSHVEELEGFPNLFNVLTSEDDPEDRWRIFTFPIDLDAALYGNNGESRIKYIMHSSDNDLKSHIEDTSKTITVNCTVAYISQCMAWNKCKDSCRTMGASSYRWFHDGCCECVGQTCINYGINDSRCKDCPESKDDLDDFPNEDDLDYGDGVGPLDNGGVESTNI